MINTPGTFKKAVTKGKGIKKIFFGAMCLFFGWLLGWGILWNILDHLVRSGLSEDISWKIPLNLVGTYYGIQESIIGIFSLLLGNLIFSFQRDKFHQKTVSGETNTQHAWLSVAVVSFRVALTGYLITLWVNLESYLSILTYPDENVFFSFEVIRINLNLYLLIWIVVEIIILETWKSLLLSWGTVKMLTFSPKHMLMIRTWIFLTILALIIWESMPFTYIRMTNTFLLAIISISLIIYEIWKKNHATTVKYQK